MDRHRIVYGLIDPASDELRYVGKSINGMRRAKVHVYRKNEKGHCGNWVRSLRAQGLRPDILVIETLETDVELDDAERFWIAYFRMIGARLTNATDGGDGWAIGDRNPMRDPAAVSRYIAANKGRKLTTEHKQAISRATSRRYEDPAERARFAGNRNPACGPGVGLRISIATKGKKKAQLAIANRLRWDRVRAARSTSAR